MSLGAGVWASLLTIAIFSLSVSMLLYFWVIEKIDVTQASLSIYLLPVFGVLLSTVVVREKITAQLVFGGLLVFAGTVLGHGVRGAKTDARGGFRGIGAGMSEVERVSYQRHCSDYSDAFYRGREDRLAFVAAARWTLPAPPALAPCVCRHMPASSISFPRLRRLRLVSEAVQHAAGRFQCSRRSTLSL